MPSYESERKLRREVTLPELIFFSIGLNIGGAIFILINVSAEVAGTTLLLSQLFSIAILAVALVPYSHMASRFPVTAGSYRYGKYASPYLSATFTFIIGICMWIGGLPLYALAAGKYISVLFPLIEPRMWGVMILTLCLLINVVGIKPTAIFQFLLTFTLISCILLFIFGGIHRIDVENLQLYSPMGAVGTLVASGLLFTLCAGGLWVVDLGSEIKYPERTYRVGLPIAVFAVFVLTFLVEIVALGTTPANLLVGKTLVEVASRFLPDQLIVLWILAAILAIFTTINAVLTIISRDAIVLSQDGVFPKILSVVNDKYRTPHNALLFSYLVALIPTLLNVSLLQLGSVLNFGMTLQFSIVLLGAYKLSKDGWIPSMAKYPSIIGFAGGLLSAAVLFLVMDIIYRIIIIISAILIFMLIRKRVQIQFDLF